jgi:hypothetical protein
MPENKEEQPNQARQDKKRADMRFAAPYLFGQPVEPLPEQQPKVVFEATPEQAQAEQKPS